MHWDNGSTPSQPVVPQEDTHAEETKLDTAHDIPAWLSGSGRRGAERPGEGVTNEKTWPARRKELRGLGARHMCVGATSAGGRRDGRGEGRDRDCGPNNDRSSRSLVYSLHL